MANSETCELTGQESETPYPSVVVAAVLTALAGGLGWGIRGQYGHETGAMIPGLLVGLTLTFLYCPYAGSLSVARVVAMTAVGFSFGGAMTYGQTLGLTQDAQVRELDLYWWGMLGCFIKGGLWIGMAGAFLGMGLSGKRYRPIEMMTLLFTLLGLMFLGMAWINEPFEPMSESGGLPAIYFSNFWGEGGPDWKPRREMWGGFLFVWAGLVMYTGIIKKDVLARNLTLIGVLAGGFGFSIGQSIQAHHAWYGPPAFLAQYDHLINWWNAMEITFGLILGFGLAIGVHLNRRRIGINEIEDGEVTLSPGNEWTLFILQAAGLATWSFLSYRWFDAVGDVAITMGMISLIGIVGGRYWPYMLSFPLVALPIAGKTLRELSYRNSEYPLAEGWVYWFVLPMLVMVLVGYSFSRRGRQGQTGRSLARWGLLLATWYYFVLNHAFFRFPWPFRYPWGPEDEATGRTPSAGIFLFCAAVLTIAVLTYGWDVRRRPSSSGPVVPQPLDPEANPAVDQ